MLIRFGVVGGLLLGAAVLWPGAPVATIFHGSDPPDTMLSPVKVACGCAAEPEPASVPNHWEFTSLLARFSGEPLDATSDALEALLFHGRRTQDHLASLDSASLKVPRLAYLHRELRRDRAQVSLRVVDRSGTVRARLGPASVPLGQKQHLHASDTSDLQPPEISLTVKRVGLHHLWTRA